MSFSLRLMMLLPQGVEDGDLNRRQLAHAFGVSEVTIDRWIAWGMPVAEAGANGRAYKFRLSACWRWKQERDAEESQRDERASRTAEQMRLALLGGKSGESEQALPPRERQLLLAVEIEFMRAAQLRGELVRFDEMVECIQELFVIIRDGMGSLPDRLARECGLDGRQVEHVIAATDDVLSETQMVLADRFGLGEPMLEAAE